MVSSLLVRCLSTAVYGISPDPVMSCRLGDSQSTSGFIDQTRHRPAPPCMHALPIPCRRSGRLTLYTSYTASHTGTTGTLVLPLRAEWLCWKLMQLCMELCQGAAERARLALSMASCRGRPRRGAAKVARFRERPSLV